MNLRFFIFIAILVSGIGGCAASDELPPAFFLSTSQAFQDLRVRALAEAAEDGDVDEIRRLASEGVNVNAMGAKGVNPLFFAIRSREMGSFVTLLELGANPNQHFGKEETIMHFAARYDDTGDFLKAALRHGGDPNVRDATSGKTPLFEAVGPDSKHNIDILLEAGADVNSKSNKGFTAVMEAAAVVQYDIVYKLIIEGADWRAITDYGVSLKSFMDIDEKVGGTDKFMREYNRVKEYIAAQENQTTN